MAWFRYRARSLAVLAVAALTVAGCGWTQTNGNAANTRNNPFEVAITTANVGTLIPSYTVSTPGFIPSVLASPTRLFVGGYDTGHGAYALDGGDGCSGSPKVCAPLWTFGRGAIVGLADPVLLVSGQAYDPAGVEGCSGAPAVCAPLWSMSADGPIYANGKIYVGNNEPWMGGVLETVGEIDASGTAGCSGTPKICAPTRTWAIGAAPPGFPVSADSYGIAFGDGFVYAVASAPGVATIAAIDPDPAAGPGPVWTATLPGALRGPIVVAGDSIYVRTSSGPSSTLYAFDAKPGSRCSGSPTVCTPAWSAPAGGWAPMVVTDGLVFTGDPTTPGGVIGYDAAGQAGCSGTPVVCAPRWTAAVGGAGLWSLTAANGVLYALSTGTGGGLHAFDARGTAGCAGTPVACSSLWDAPALPSVGDVLVANGTLVIARDGGVTAFRLPG